MLGDGELRYLLFNLLTCKVVGIFADYGTAKSIGDYLCHESDTADIDKDTPLYAVADADTFTVLYRNPHIDFDPRYNIYGRA